MTDARTLDFDTGGSLAYDVKAPERTAEETAALERARLYAREHEVRETAAETSVRNAAAYWAERANTDRETIAASNAFAAWQKVAYPNGAWNFGSLDLGLLPVAVVVVKDLVLLAGTGGLAAPSVAKDFSNFKETVKSVRSLGDAKEFAADAQARANAVRDRIERTKKVFTVGEGGIDATVGAAGVADQILGNPAIAGAADIIQNTQDLALSGDVDAQRGTLILAKVAGARKNANLAPGMALLPPKTAEQAAQIAAAAQRDVRDLTDSEATTLGAVKTWWQRFIDWLF